MAPNRQHWTGWIWPVPITNGRRPVISHEFEPGERYKLDGSLNYAVHLGVDLMFPRLRTDPTGPATDVAIPKRGGNPGWIAWPGTPVRSAGPGRVWQAKRTKLGYSLQIDHGHVGGAGVLTFYQHLEHPSREWRRDDVVLAGTELGVMGGDPSGAPHLRHLHFELWFPDGAASFDEWPVDPEPYLKIWTQA